jgi:hypothetical protein
MHVYSRSTMSTLSYIFLFGSINSHLWLLVHICEACTKLCIYEIPLQACKMFFLSTSPQAPCLSLSHQAPFLKKSYQAPILNIFHQALFLSILYQTTFHGTSHQPPFLNTLLQAPFLNTLSKIPACTLHQGPCLSLILHTIALL